MMSLINTLHMVGREESFSEASSAPITDGSIAIPAFLSALTHLVWGFLLFSPAAATDATGLVVVGEGRCPELCLRSALTDTDQCVRVSVGGLPQKVT